MNRIEIKKGDRYERLTILEELYVKGGNRKFLCICDCKKKVVVLLNSLRSKRTKSCGCLKLERAKEKNKNGKHYMSSSKEYSSWAAMITRCTNKNHHAYKKYNKYLNERWLKFENFFEDMGERPQGMSLDRIDNSKGYSKENCRWATPEEQSNNTSNNRKVTYKGVVYNLSQLIKKINMNRSTFEARLRRGWKINDIVEKKIGNNFKSHLR